MSLDRSLRARNTLVRHRNVLTRAERIAYLKAQDRWMESMKPLGLPKVANRKAKAGRKRAKAAEAPAEAAAAAGAGTAPTAPAAAAPAAASKPAPKPGK